MVHTVYKGDFKPGEVRLYDLGVISLVRPDGVTEVGQQVHIVGRCIHEECPDGEGFLEAYVELDKPNAANTIIGFFKQFHAHNGGNCHAET